MTQRIFDIENEKDMADLWDIVPEDIATIEKGVQKSATYITDLGIKLCCQYININWHDKTEITRPIQEATKADVGKICRFWNDKEYSDDVCFGILNDIREDESCGKVYLRNKEMWCGHARRLTKQEIKELC